MNEQEQIDRARRAKEITDDPLWAEAWSMYRARLVDIIDRADSGQTDVIMHAKRLMAASKAAQQHMTAIMQEGALAAAQIKLDEEKRKWWQRAA